MRGCRGLHRADPRLCEHQPSPGGLAGSRQAPPCPTGSRFSAELQRYLTNPPGSSVSLNCVFPSQWITLQPPEKKTSNSTTLGRQLSAAGQTGRVSHRGWGDADKVQHQSHPESHCHGHRRSSALWPGTPLWASIFSRSPPPGPSPPSPPHHPSHCLPVTSQHCFLHQGKTPWAPMGAPQGVAAQHTKLGPLLRFLSPPASSFPPCP